MTNEKVDPDVMALTIRKVTAVVKVLKARYTNLTAEEAVALAGEIVVAVEEAGWR